MVDHDKNRLQKLKESMKRRLKLLSEGEPPNNEEPSETEEETSDEEDDESG